MDGEMGEWVDRWMVEWMGRWVSVLVNGRVVEW